MRRLCPLWLAIVIVPWFCGTQLKIAVMDPATESRLKWTLLEKKQALKLYFTRLEIGRVHCKLVTVQPSGDRSNSCLLRSEELKHFLWQTDERNCKEPTTKYVFRCGLLLKHFKCPCREPTYMVKRHLNVARIQCLTSVISPDKFVKLAEAGVHINSVVAILQVTKLMLHLMNQLSTFSEKETCEVPTASTY